MTSPVALTIAGSDPSGGAGIQADLKTFHQHDIYGMAVITLLTVQNTQRVEAVQVLEPGFVLQQIDAVLADIPPGAAKTGALGSAAMVEAVADRAAGFTFPLVVDPVMISKHGTPLLPADAVEALRTRLLPRAYLVTPNLPEAAALAGIEVTDAASMERAAAAIAQQGPRHVLIKGGRLADEALDLLWSDGKVTRLRAPHVETTSIHGTGCVYSAAITAALARGTPLLQAVRQAKCFITHAIETAPALGSGYGPVNMHATYDDVGMGIE